MKTDRRLVLTVGACALASAMLIGVFSLGSVLLMRSDMGPEQREVLAQLLDGRWPLTVLTACALVGLAAAAAPWLYRRHVAAPACLAEQAAVLAASEVSHKIDDPSWPAEMRALAAIINTLVAQREGLRAHVEQQVSTASRRIELERRRLAALMSELTHSIVVCNLDGRVLLYNARARLQFRAMSTLPTAAAGAEWLGLGRSIYAVFDRELVAHALEKLHLRLQRGASQPTAQFVTVTASGQLLRARMAPVLIDRAASQESGPGAVLPGAAPPRTDLVLSGFVLVLDNLSPELERNNARASRHQRLIQEQRALVSRLRHAVEQSTAPNPAPGQRDQARADALRELEALDRQITQTEADGARELVTRWPLEEMRGADFVQAAARRIEIATGQAVQSAEVDAALWLKLDSYALLQAVTGLAQRLKDERAVSRVALRLQPAAGDRVHLDLAWSGHAMSTETALAWELAPVAPGGQASPLTVREVVQRHGGEFWFARDPDPDTDPDLQRVCFRFLLPQAPAAAAAEAAQEQLEAAFVRNDSRPEYYDFDLFARAEAGHALDDRRLADLSYTVFDTETTGLDPAGGDEIIQIGAVRLVNGRLLRGEGFEQLVDPRRPIPAASIPIHGITPEMVARQPTLDQVLPAFHRYAQDTVLVAHNAAFDLRFLQLKEASTGLRFEQPVLDTLLLSAVVHPNQESHRLEAIAERFGVSVIGRHTAMGDAMVTAEVFQKLVPLLAERGIHTLGQAREAAQKTWYARLEY